MTGLPPILNIIRSRRVSLLGHVARLGPDIPPNIAITTDIGIMFGTMPEGWRRLGGRLFYWIRYLRTCLTTPGTTCWLVHMIEMYGGRSQWHSYAID